MSLKQSRAFAAFRSSLITDKEHAILHELAPAYNERVAEIRQKVEDDFQIYHNRAKADNFRKSLVYDLELGLQQTLDSVQKDLQERIHERLNTDGAQVITEKIPDRKREGREKEVLTAIFPDGTKARVPHALWIDYKLFDRV